MADPCDEALAAALRGAGYSALFVRPPWYRLYRLLGVRLPLPVRMGLVRNVLYQAVCVAALFSALYGAAWITGFLSRFPGLAIVLLTVVIPLINALRYRRARRRLEAAPPPGAGSERRGRHLHD